jgi:hypothetical protein
MPRVRQQESMAVDIPKDGYGLQLPFTTDSGVTFTLVVNVSKGSAQSAPAATHAA